jgi:hypothetical protein
MALDAAVGNGCANTAQVNQNITLALCKFKIRKL